MIENKLKEIYSMKNVKNFSYDKNEVVSAVRNCDFSSADEIIKLINKYGIDQKSNKYSDDFSEMISPASWSRIALDKKVMDVMEKYSEEGFVIKGSWAMKLLFKDFERVPNDIDLSWGTEDEVFLKRYESMKLKRYLKIDEENDFFQWEDSGQRVEILITLSAVKPIIMKIGGNSIKVESPEFILAQKICSLLYLTDDVISKRPYFITDISFLLGKVSVDLIDKKIIEVLCSDYFKVNQQYLFDDIVDDLEIRLNKFFTGKQLEGIILVLERIKTIAAKKTPVDEKMFFNFKESRFNNDN